jgi:autonomous glycyl radical cofactor GrcA
MRKLKKRGKPPTAPVLRAVPDRIVRRVIPAPVSDGSIGRPSKFCRELFESICERISNGESLQQLCRDPEMPSTTTIRKWLRNEEKDPLKAEFGVAYTRARKALLDHWAEEIVSISDDGSNDYVDREVARGRTVRMADQEHINRSRLRVDTRRWLLSKLEPKKYGDKIDLTVGAKDNVPIPTVAMTPQEAAKAYLTLMEKPGEDDETGG